MKHFSVFLSLHVLLAGFATSAIAASSNHVDLEKAAHNSNAGLPQLDPSSYPTQIFWLLITFGALYYLFSTRILPELSAIIENRREIIQDHLDKADSLKNKAEKVHDAYDEILSEAHEEASNMFHSVDETMKEKTDIDVKKMHSHISDMVSQTEERIDKSRAEAISKMDGVAAEIASQAAQKIIGITTDLDQARNIVENLNNKKAA